MISYCAPIWINGLERKYNIQKIRRIQRLICLRIIRGYRTISYESSILLAGLEPIELKLKEISDLFKLNNGVSESLLPKFLEKPIDFRMIPHPINNFLLRIDEYDELNNYDYNIYTDGSKNICEVGAAFCIFKDKNELFNNLYRLGHFCTVFQAELLAIKEALEFTNINLTNNSNMNIGMFTDSKSSIDAIKIFNNTNPLVFEIRSIIKKLSEKNMQITFYWAKSHIGISGNERADILAKEASKLAITEPTYNLYPKSFAKSLFQNETIQQMITQWEKIWPSSTNGLITKQYSPSVRERQKISHLDLNFKLTQFLTGRSWKL